ncbi:hypothetical protein Back2_04170 [Nocardioides baekrokdamisoli]|uniref:Uncharacterized protein n=1 Tax=Nocardioides baekrokdamisoli TaxID=1804624 RepID=A0A3G9IBD1_9ACTN|nr:hypothetical protein Back2_04170 [Nocardioides baekrokdamisoli]
MLSQDIFLAVQSPVGIVALGIFVLMVLGLVLFAGGREHS